MNPVSTAEYAAHSASKESPVSPDASMDSFDQLPLPYIELDKHGVITRANRATLELHPAGRGELIGQTAWNLVAADEKDPSFAAYCAALESGEQPGVVYRSLYDRSKQFRTYQIHRALIRDDDGNPTGMRMLCVDVTETKKTQEETRRNNLWLDSVLDSVCEALIATDAVGFIRKVNPAAEMLLGWQADDLKGMPIEQGLPITSFLPGGCEACTFTTWLEGPMKGIASVLDRKHREIYVRLGASPILDTENGSTAGAVLLLRKVEIRR